MAVVTSRNASMSASVKHGMLWLLRAVGAGLLLAMGGIHWWLWAYDSYQEINIIGPLFLLNAIGGAVLAIAVLATPRRFLVAVAALSWLFTVGTLLALVLSLTLPGGLFGFTEFIGAPLVTTAIGVEAAGILELAALAVVARRLDRRR